MGNLLPSSLCPGSQDGLLQGYDSFPFQLPTLLQQQPCKQQGCSAGSYTHTSPFHASSSLRTSRKEQQKLKLSRVGNAWDMGGLVGSVHPEIRVAVAVFWLSMDTAVPGDS